MYVFVCVCVSVCVCVLDVFAGVREHRPNGSLLVDRLCVEQFYFL